MCLAIPMQLTARCEFEGTATLHGVRRAVSLLLCPEAAVGDHVLVHAGFVIGRIDEAEAAATLALLDEGLARERAANARAAGEAAS